MENRIKKMTTPKALLINVIWLSALLAAGYYVLDWIDPYKEELEIIRNPNKIELSKEMGLDASISSVLSDRGTAYVKLGDSRDIFIVHSRNYDYNEPWLDDFLQVGDHLLKNKNSDTLWIGRGNDKYYFVIGEFINEKK
jgi:hypothetical protein